MYYVYTLYDKIDDRFYVGFTANLKRRLSEHRKKQVHTTKRFNTFCLIHYESYISESDARRRELYFKTTQGKRTLRLMLRDSLENIRVCPIV